MPQTTPERAARWPGYDAQATKFLEDAGYLLTKDWCWIKPTSEHEPTNREADAVICLIEEWDFGGIRDVKRYETRFRTTKANSLPNER